MALAVAACSGDAKTDTQAGVEASSTPPVTATTAPAVVPSASASVSDVPNLCDLVTKDKLEVIAEKPNTQFEKSSNGKSCQFRHTVKVEGEQFEYFGLNGSVMITAPSASVLASGMKNFADAYPDKTSYPCDAGDECLVFKAGSATQGRMRKGQYLVYFSSINVRVQGKSTEENTTLEKARTAKLAELVASVLT